METRNELAIFPGAVRTSDSSTMASMRPRPAVDLEVIVPAYNEADRISSTLLETVKFLEAQSWSSRVVVVDNGSSDDTGSVVRRFAHEKSGSVPITLIGCGRPGKGAAVRRGILSGTSRFTGFFDADMATPVETLSVAMGHLERGAAAVIASRHCPGSTFIRHQPLGRRLGGMAFRAITRSMVQEVHDTQCGFKFFNRGAINQALVQCRTTGFAFDVELLHRLQGEGGQIVEVPVAWTDSPSSTFRPIRDGAASFSAVFQM